MSAETDFNSKEVEILSPENGLGEQNILWHCSKHPSGSEQAVPEKKLVTAKSENDTPFSLLGETEGDPPCPRPVLKQVRVILHSHFWVRQRNRPSAPGLC